MTRIRRLVAMILISLLAAVVPSFAAAAAERVNIGYVMVMDDAPAMVAKEAGFYEAKGLQPNLVMFDSGTDLIKSIVTGQLDAGVLGFTNALTWVSQGADLKIVGGAQMGYHSILVRKGLGIKTVADLKGRSLASQKQGSTADIVLEGVTLAQAGLKREDLRMVYTSPATAVQSLVAGRVDAAFLFEPFDRIARLTAPVEEIYEIGKVWPFPCMVVITSGKALREKKAVIYKILDAQKQAIELLQNDPRRAAKLLAPYFVPEGHIETPKGRVSGEEVTLEAIKTQTFHWAIDDAQIQRMKEIAKIMEAQGALAKPVDVNAALDLSWQKQVGR